MRELQIEGLHPSDLTRRQRLVLVYAVCIVSIVLLYAVLYNLGMSRLEDRPQSIFRSLQTVTETMTTTGFGAGAPWEAPAMNLLMITIQVTGILIGFVALRILVIPLFERTPLNLDDRLTAKDDLVVVAEYRRDTDILLDELEELDVGYVLLESDENEAKRLSDDGYQAINGDPEDSSDLERAMIERASLLITDAGDRTASIVLTALEANEDLRAISFTESTRHDEALGELGVDRSVAPHALIGRRLAEKATTPVVADGPTGGGAESITVREILVRRESPLHGVRVDESPIADHPDLTLVGGWFDGSLRLSPPGDVRLAPNTVLVVAGPERAIDDVSSEVSGVRTPRTSERSRVVVTVDDATALLTVATARSLSDDVEILARVTYTEKATPAFKAGADYVLSIQRVSARLVAAEVHGERMMDPTSQIRLVRTDAEPFAGDPLADVRRNTERGWTVVSLVRDGTVVTDGRTTIEAGDEAIVAGSDETIREFERTVDAS